MKKAPLSLLEEFDWKNDFKNIDFSTKKLSNGDIDLDKHFAVSNHVVTGALKPLVRGATLGSLTGAFVGAVVPGLTADQGAINGAFLGAQVEAAIYMYRVAHKINSNRSAEQPRDPEA